MGWEIRRSRSYYYRKERDGARVRSVYVGAGPLAQAVAELERRDAAVWVALGADLHSTREEGAVLARVWAELHAYTRLLVAAHLTLGGFRLHRRQWRCRRYSLPEAGALRSLEPMPARKKAPPKTPPQVPAGPVRGRLTAPGRGTAQFALSESPAPADLDAARALVERCNTSDPDPADLGALREWVRRDGVMMKAERLADAARACALSGWRNATSEEMALEGLRDLRERLGFATAPPVERLLIELVCTGWLVVTVEEARLQRLLAPGGYLITQAEALERRVQRAHGRFLRAVETLERVRALQTVTAVRAGEATPTERALARAELARREAARAGGSVPALPEHAGDGAADPAEAPALVTV